MAVVELVLLALLVGDEEVHAVERDPAVVADDAAAAVGVRQAGDDPRRAGLADVRRVGVEHAVVVRLAVLGEDLAEGRVRLVAVGLETRRDDAPAAERHDRPLERRVGLQADDDLAVLVDVAGLVREDAGGNLRHVEDALLAFLGEQRLQRLPHALRALGRTLQELAVPLVRGVVALNELADVDPALPRPRGEAAPGDFPLFARDFRIGDHAILLRMKLSARRAAQRARFRPRQNRSLTYLYG